VSSGRPLEASSGDAARRPMRVLVVEPIPAIGEAVALALARKGATIVGPAGTPELAMPLVRAEILSAAVVTIDFSGGAEAERIVEVLSARGIPVLLVYAGVPEPVPGSARCPVADCMMDFNELADVVLSLAT
jgi:NAD(P)-dependent dehydrogenase (short-subunit alcohol dehydrogenase family)